MESDEVLKLVDGIYKNILDKFNPGARQLINAGKAYLKALHGSAAAARLYIDAIAKLAQQAQQSAWHGSSDVGTSLMQIAEVYQEIHAQQMNVLKAFYVDLIVPLENNLEKDIKIVQSEQKKFCNQHKNRHETYSKAANTMKKHRKKNKSKGTAISKELRAFEEEKTKLDGLCEKGLKNAITQERRRYGFVLERQCILAKHVLSYHSLGSAAMQRHMDDWRDVARNREVLPDTVELAFANKMQQLSYWPDKDIYSQPRTSISTEDLDDSCSVVSQLHKAKSLDAHCFEKGGSGGDSGYSVSHTKQLPRTKSDFNLTSNHSSIVQELEQYKKGHRSKSIAAGDDGSASRNKRNNEKFCRLARALYAYISSGENQLSFLEGDVIALMGERNKGWQFGENMRTQRSGWFPLAYTELMVSQNDSDDSSPSQRHINLQKSDTPNSGNSGNSDFSFRSAGNLEAINGALSLPNLKHAPSFKKTLHQEAAVSFNSSNMHLNLPPVPTNSAPRPNKTIQKPTLQILTPSWSTDEKKSPSIDNSSSMYSSSDSGFIMEPPALPEVDYEDNNNIPLIKNSFSAMQTMPMPSPVKTFAECDKRNWLLYKSALELWDDVEKNNNDPELVDYYASLSKIPQVRATNAPVKRSKTLWGLKFKPKSGFLTGGRKNAWQSSSSSELDLSSKNNVSKTLQRPREPPPLPPLPPPRRELPPFPNRIAS
ncbi:brain-specific angiogenesis inhibitor 1-associated protein 2 isoform X2 [Neocloeon triangulifer]|uniref:brain-specific angiogenesis inhibitor 1-associated protein 2 isoform X2 n=1 Tax=Neocloeon triangulifer TaxID=2078957 RepID=UPI00286EF82F|nr:brain-specific angiogenesis inhibitor 1-associated protein 2 isoform X2 [Neocloeon triangulifer]